MPAKKPSQKSAIPSTIRIIPELEQTVTTTSSTSSSPTPLLRVNHSPSMIYFIVPSESSGDKKPHRSRLS
jgi:hypothetical protein